MYECKAVFKSEYQRIKIDSYGKHQGQYKYLGINEASKVIGQKEATLKKKMLKRWFLICKRGEDEYVTSGSFGIADSLRILLKIQ